MTRDLVTAPIPEAARSEPADQGYGPVIVVTFGAPPPADLLRELPPRSTRVIDWAMPVDRVGQPDPSRPPPHGSADAALALLRRLNTLTDSFGSRYPEVVRYHGYQPWWCHQQSAFDEYIRPYLRYLPLLTEFLGAARIVLCDCPDDLRRLLPLVLAERRVELGMVGTRPPRLRRIRQIGSRLFYRTATALALTAARIRRPDCIVFSFDAELRDGRHPWLEGLYRALDRAGVSILDVVWSSGGAHAMRGLVGRRRPTVFCQAVARDPDRVPASPAPPVDPDDLDERFLRALAIRVLMPRCRDSIETMDWYERWLVRIRPRGAYFMDDYVHAFELLIACKRLGIPTVAVQHGQFNRYSVGLMAYGSAGSLDQSFDRYCVWGEHFAELLARHSQLIPRGSVVVAGSPRGAPDPAEQAPRRSEVASGEVVLFLAENYDAKVQEREVSPYLGALAAAGLEVRIKSHPRPTPTPLPSPGPDPGRRPDVVDGPLEPHLASATVVVGSYSSAIFEAILHERPVVLLATSQYVDPHGLAASGLAALANSPAEIVARVLASAKLPRAELARRREVVWGSVARDGAEIAVDEMERLRTR